MIRDYSSVLCCREKVMVFDNLTRGIESKQMNSKPLTRVTEFKQIAFDIFVLLIVIGRHIFGII